MLVLRLVLVRAVAGAHRARGAAVAAVAAPGGRGLSRLRARAIAATAVDDERAAPRGPASASCAGEQRGGSGEHQEQGALLHVGAPSVKVYEALANWGKIMDGAIFIVEDNSGSLMI